jgi:hypothetical protein
LLTCTSPSLNPVILLSTMFPNISNLYSPLTVTDHVYNCADNWRRPLWTRSWEFRFHERRVISWLSWWQFSSQERHRSMELVTNNDKTSVIHPSWPLLVRTSGYKSFGIITRISWIHSHNFTTLMSMLLFVFI